MIRAIMLEDSRCLLHGLWRGGGGGAPKLLQEVELGQHRLGQHATKEMINRCLIYLHVISLVGQHTIDWLGWIRPSE